MENTINYLIGDAARPQIAGNKIIAHVCNDIGGWGRGFVLSLSKLSPLPERAYRGWYAGRAHNDFALGAVQFIPISPGLIVANMIGQHGVRSATNAAPIRYDAVERALEIVGQKAVSDNAGVHMPRIGAGLAGGLWEIIERLIIKQLCAHKVEVYVYDLP